jgi:Mrp family chromosome partitioning ATPase
MAAVTQWLAARARNALRRPLRIIGVSSTAFIAALLTLILIPHETTRAAARLLATTQDRPDTFALVHRVARLQVAQLAAESAVVRDRLRARAARQAFHDSLVARAASSGGGTRRDSLTADRAELTSLVALVTRSPLPTSYRALGDARALKGDPRVRVLLDSLTVVVRARDALSSNRTDVPYLALTARLASIGQAIEAIATARARALGTEITVLSPDATRAAPRVPHVDTTIAHTRLDSVGLALAPAALALADARRVDSALDARVDQARAIAGGSAPPLALMAAALVLGLAVGFAVTFGTELSTPRVSDGPEASRVAGVPILATVGPRLPDPRRMRRKTDKELSTLIDVNSESYRYVYLSVSGADAAASTGFPLVAVTGDEAEVVGTVATNIAVASAHDSRTTLLIDADRDAAVVAGILGMPRAPGVSDVLAGRAEWSSIVSTAVIGRDRLLNVMPAGSKNGGVVVEMPDSSFTDAEVGDVATETGEVPSENAVRVTTPGGELRAELLRLGRRYDLVVVAAPAGAAQVGPDSVLPVSEAIVCVRVAFTPLARLASAVATLRESRLHVRGVVLWDADVPPRLSES